MSAETTIVSAGNSEELEYLLKQIDISVASRTGGRTSGQAEIYSACHLLATLDREELLQFSVRLAHRDRPDFLLQSGIRSIGIEMTEAIPLDYARYCALAEREFPEVPIEPNYFRYGQPKLSLERLRELLTRELPTPKPWMADRPEQEWTLHMNDAIAEKQSKLASSTFGKFQENWLCVYDNLPLAGVHLQKGVALLTPLLANYWSKAPHFDSIFIEHGPVIVQMTATGSVHLALRDLWD